MDDRLSKEEVLHVAELARIAINEDELEKYQIQLKQILDSVDKIKEVEVDDNQMLIANWSEPTKLRKDESWGAQYLSDGQLWFIVDNYSGSNYGGSKKIPAVTHTEYRYRDRATVYTYHYYRWSDWSSWSTTSYSKSATREVKTQTQYCYRPN